MTDHIKTSRDGRVLTITINRPEKKNAITQAMYGAIADGLSELDRDDALRAAVITGEGTMFTSGNDITDFASDMDGDNVPPVIRFLRGILHTEKPVVAAVNGPAIGVGLTMLLHCDVAYASEAATFAAPFVKVGVVPEAASSVLLPKAIGMAMASEVMLAGRVLTAQEALSVGLVSKVVSPDDLQQEAADVAGRLAALAPTAMKRAKSLIRHDRTELQSVMEREGVLFADQLQSAEFAEVAAAFMQKRAPKFD